MRHDLPSDGTNCGALVVVILSVVHIVLFFAETGVLECMDISDMNTLFWFEVMEVVCHKWGKANEV
jgi:hypothetical protein